MHRMPSPPLRYSLSPVMAGVRFKPNVSLRLTAARNKKGLRKLGIRSLIAAPTTAPSVSKVENSDEKKLAID